MRIQININDDFDSYDLKDMLSVVVYNKDNWIKLYNNEYWDRNKIRKVDGSSFIKTNIEWKCNGKTLYVKVKKLK